MGEEAIRRAARVQEGRSLRRFLPERSNGLSDGDCRAALEVLATRAGL